MATNLWKGTNSLLSPKPILSFFMEGPLLLKERPFLLSEGFLLRMKRPLVREEQLILLKERL